MKKLITLWLCLFIIAGCQKKSSKSTPVTTSSTDIGVSERYAAYLAQIDTYESEKGVAKPVEVSDGYYQIQGVSFTKLVDFEGDDEEELLLVYLSDEEYTIYTYEIYGYVNESIKLLGSGSLFGTDGNVQTVRLCDYDDSIYLISGSEDSFFDYSFLTVIDDKMSIKKTIKGDMDDQIATIDGEKVSYETAEEELKEWTANEQAFVLNYDCDLVLEQIDATRGILLKGITNDESIVADNTYVIKKSNKVKLKRSDLKKLTLTELNYARNEIYARHGRKFKTTSLQDYFNTKAWYDGVIEPDDFKESELSDIERYNIKLIQQYEAEKKAELKK